MYGQWLYRCAPGVTNGSSPAHVVQSAIDIRCVVTEIVADLEHTWLFTQRTLAWHSWSHRWKRKRNSCSVPRSPWELAHGLLAQTDEIRVTEYPAGGKTVCAMKSVVSRMDTVHFF